MQRGMFGRPLAALVVFVILVARAGFGAEDATKSTDWTTLVPGLWYRPWSFSRSTDDAVVIAHVFRADPRILRVTVLDARRPDRGVARADELRKETGAYLVVNGSFFDENGKPLGLAIGDGRTLSGLRKVDQGVFLISNGKALIQHAKDPLASPIETALQAGPRLVVEGRALHLKPQVSRRTAICIPGDGSMVILVFPTAVSLADLAANLVRPAAKGGLGCWSALNLDGGPSTQLSVQTPALELDVEGGWGVPNGLAVLGK